MQKDELMRRVLDGECSAEEKEYHAEMLRSDSGYRLSFEAIESLKVDMRMLPEPCMDQSIKDSIMEQVMERRRMQTVSSANTSNQTVQPASEGFKPFKWAYVCGLGFSCLLGLVIGFFLARYAERPQEQRPVSSDSSRKTGHSETHTLKQNNRVNIEENARIGTTHEKEEGLDKTLDKETTLVRFVVHAPNAENVILVGDFNNWSREASVMTDPENSGTWRITIPLQSGTYRYKFLVDGKHWVNDPGADGRINDGFGGFNSLIRL